MNRKTNPRELKMKEDLELLSRAVLKQHDAITALNKENALLKDDKLVLLQRLEEGNKLIGRLERKEQDREREMRDLLDFKDKAIPMLEAYFALV